MTPIAGTTISLQGSPTRPGRGRGVLETVLDARADQYTKRAGADIEADAVEVYRLLPIDEAHKRYGS